MCEITLVPTPIYPVTPTEPNQESEGTKTWKVSLSKGVQRGISVRVSGKGAWAKLNGQSEFTVQKLESSKTFNSMKDKYGIEAGVGGFYKWLGFGGNAKKHKAEISQALNELSNDQTYKGSANIDMYVSGLIPGFEVTASAYIFILQVEDSSGNSFTVGSSGKPEDNTGASDEYGNEVPNKDNKSTLTI
ncbi:hypothetical protein BA953_24755 (plasmid) [Vibrio coralliilyticus]|uniref:hypothetical protein n=1 Tax=Vibrio coralliilyticus TaxID=190893 RepID=UPI000810A198|nr:hypothetical protein [Vibrio coralliilyticus]ANW27408.1 hypothetical protein BA953_24755 [Vibrio coralliilyticus]